MLTEDRDLETVEAELQAAREEVERYRKAVAAMLTVCVAAASGDLEPRVRDLGLGDDVDRMRRGLNHLLDLTDAFVREAATSLAFASDGKFFRRLLTRGLHGSFRAAAIVINRGTDKMAENARQLQEAKAQRLRLADDFERVVQASTVQVAEAAAGMRGRAVDLSRAAEDTAGQAESAAQGAEAMSENVTAIAAATEELTATVGDINRQVANSSQAARAAVDKTAHATQAVTGLDEASRQIGQVVQVITTVADQTRLLALNASIEAARAGSTGKGFAVVAAEVKNLATQTATATQQITKQVEAIQTATKNAMEAMGSIAGTIERFDNVAGDITRAVSEQQIATNAISGNIHQTAEVTREVSASIQAVDHSTRATSTVAGEMKAAADALAALGDGLTRAVGEFLRGIRG